MALTLVDTPEYDSGSGVISNVAAGLSQLPYLFQRDDYITCRGEANAGVMRIIIPIDGVNPSALTEVLVGSMLWFNCSDPTFTGQYQVANIFVSGATVEIRCNTTTPYAGGAVTGTVNLLNGARQDYRVRVWINDGANVGLIIAPMYFQTESNGRMFFDASKVLIQFLQDHILSELQYVLRYQEYYNGAEIGSSISTNQIMAVSSKKQQGDFGGSNVWDQLPNAAGAFLGWDRRRARDGGQGFVGGLNNSNGANTWTFTANEMRRGALGTGITSSYGYFPDSPFVDGSIPRGSMCRIEVNFNILGTAFVSGGQYRVFIRAVNDGQTPATGAGTVIGSAGYNYTSFHPNRPVSLNFTVQSSISANGLMIAIGGQGGSHAADIVITKVVMHSIIGGRVFLTKFKPPAINPTLRVGSKLWVGWARKIRWIMDSGFTARTTKAGLQVVVNTFDVNYENAPATGIVQYGNVVGVNELSVEPQELTNRYWMRTLLRSDDGNTIMSENQWFRIIEPAQQCKRPLMVEWANSLGGLDQHLFGIEQVFNTESEEGILFETPITDNYEVARETVGRIVEDVREKITVMAENLNLVEMRALMEIKASNYVAIWLDVDGTNYMKVRVLESTETSYSNKGRDGHSVTIVLEPPKNFSLYDSGIYDLLEL